MQTNPNETTTAIEPVEEYLQRVLCVDKLALYQPIIDAIKNAQMFDIMDTLNGVVLLINDDDAGTKFDQINDTLITSLRQMLSNFDVIVDSDDIKFLAKLFDALQILDVYDDHQTIVNLCLTGGETPKDKLYQLVNLIDYVDEHIFMSSVKLVSLGLIDKIHQLHDAALEQIEEITANEVDFAKIGLFRELAKRNPQLIAAELVREHQLSAGMNVQAITNLITHRFHEVERTPEFAKDLAKELVACYLLSDVPLEQVPETIKSQYQYLINDETVILQVNALLNAVFTEVKAYGQT